MKEMLWHHEERVFSLVFMSVGASSSCISGFLLGWDENVVSMLFNRCVHDLVALPWYHAYRE